MRKCIYAFFQPQGREPSYAKQLFQEGKGASPSLSLAGRAGVATDRSHHVTPWQQKHVLEEASAAISCKMPKEAVALAQ